MGWREELLNGLQAASNAVAGNVSGPVDLLNLGLGKLGLPVSDAPVGGSAWMAARGLTRPVQPGASQVAGETLGLLGPALTAAYAPQIARGLLAAGDAMPSASTGRAIAPNQKGIFAGTNAQNANLKALETAKGRIARGDDPAKVWAETGWGKGPDGKWRFEISDDVMPVKIDLNKQALENYPEVQQAFGHKELFKAYPELGQLRLANSVDSRTLGGYLPRQKVIELNVPAKGASSPDTNKAQALTAVHELQHAVQQAEGFARGGSADNVGSLIEAQIQRLKKDARTLNELAYSGDPLGSVLLKPGARARALAADKQAADLADQLGRIREFGQGFANDAYLRLGGEAESRLVEARKALTAAERAAQYPWNPPYFQQTTGVPIEKLIFYNGLLD